MKLVYLTKHGYWNDNVEYPMNGPDNGIPRFSVPLEKAYVAGVKYGVPLGSPPGQWVTLSSQKKRKKKPSNPLLGSTDFSLSEIEKARKLIAQLTESDPSLVGSGGGDCS